MSADHYALYAIKYAQLARRSSANFLGGDAHDTDMPLFYYVWVVQGGGRTVVVDTGFNAEVAHKRGRTITRPVAEGLLALGIDPQNVEHVVVTHLHYDHIGNHALFPTAQYYLQDQEMDFATGRCMAHAALNHGYEVDDVTEMVRRVYENRCGRRVGGRDVRDHGAHDHGVAWSATDRSQRFRRRRSGRARYCRAGASSDAADGGGGWTGFRSLPRLRDARARRLRSAPDDRRPEFDNSPDGFR